MTEISVDEAAPKVFFVDPDPSIVSEKFLETAFFQGFETYALSNNLGGDLKKKVQVLTKVFSNVILFFTIDRKGSLNVWIEYLRELQEDYERCTRIGILYSQVHFQNLERIINQKFNFDIGITAGCVSLGVSPRQNHDTLLKVLTVNEANGRRKLIRMKCSPACRVSFPSEKKAIDGNLLDLSMSHFSIVMTADDPNWAVGTKIEKIQMRIDGSLLIANAIVAIKRENQGQKNYVFVFSNVNGKPGLDDFLKQKVGQIICNHFQSETMRFLLEQLQA